MNSVITIAELSGLAMLILVAIALGRRLYGAGKVVIGQDAQHSVRDALNQWAAFVGIVLIAVFCWLLAWSMLGEARSATMLAICIFIGIGANLLDEGFGASD
jgi:uncharacterized membrane protein